MALVLKYFWRQVLRSTAQGKCPVLNDLGKSKIGEFNVAIGSYEHILRLQVPVNDILAMEILKDKNQLCRIEPK